MDVHGRIDVDLQQRRTVEAFGPHIVDAAVRWPNAIDGVGEAWIEGS